MIVWLIENGIVAGLLALVALALSPLFRRRPAAVHLLWLVVVARLVLPSFPLPTSAWSEVDDLLARGPGDCSEASSEVWAKEMPKRPGKKPGLRKKEVRLRDEPYVVSIGVEDADASWVAGLAGRLPSAVLDGLALLVLGVGLVLVSREVRRSSRLLRGTRGADVELRRRVGRLARSLGMKSPELRVHPGLTSPLILCRTRPMLLVPRDAELPDCVLVHELSHVARCDHWTARLELLALLVHWWNPLFFFAQRRMRAASELSCDARAVDYQRNSETEYARALIDAVERESFRGRGATALALGGPSNGFEARLRLILEGRLSRGIPPLLGIVLVGLLALSLPAWGHDERPARVRSNRAAAEIPPAERTLLEMFEVADWGELHHQALGDLRESRRNGYGWHRLGFALLGMGEFDRAALAFERQRETGWRSDLAIYNMACASCRGGHLDKAMSILEELVRLDPGVRKNIARDGDLAPLRSHPRYEALLAGAR